ncbi:hypothetical protein P106B_28 [Rhizobium phage vB_RglS_P106B]|uniref:Uncharacterized protein n=1 Tax=Rhizobium phage vB_RglS_P106B TaxID=1458697 RepID=W6EKF5_9CAUD|nr:hypothetical protein P106B_28 [Rhizobium phage vB_RglS_P106B]AHJ10711.1 hypothetical protein P106B_28 [Rhizobium phage vB_RglS_P106B]
MKSYLAILLASAFANSNAASKLYVCATPQNVELAQADYEGLTWVEIKSVGSRGETGKSTNILTYDTWDTTVIQKAKGMTDAGSPELEVARLATDPGQNILRAAGAVGNNNNYAFREVRADGAIGGTGTIRYNRGLVAGPKSPGGRNEDFDLELFTIGFQQEEIVVNPTVAGNPPVLTVNPAITGTPEVGETLTVSDGTFTGDAVITYTYQWFAGGVAIAGANASTFDLTAAQLGKVITARVHATNASGSASGYAAPTAAVTNP